METIQSIIDTHSGGPEMVSAIKRAILRLTSEMQLGEAAADVLDRFYPELQLYALALATSKGQDRMARKLLSDEWAKTWTSLKRTFS